MFKWSLKKKHESERRLSALPAQPVAPEPQPGLETDLAWEEWGRREPYFGVITHTRFRRAELTEQARQDFFDSGQVHVEYVLQAIRRHLNASFVPSAVLDFGCGVGRTTLPFARVAQRVVGADVSSTMLEEAKRNGDLQRAENVQWVASDDSLSQLTGSFDLIHSFIVFQHIPPERGKLIFRQLLARVRPGGMAAIHFSHSKRQYAVLAGEVGAKSAPAASMPPPPLVTVRETDPEMQMNLYPMNELMMMIQEAGGHRLHAELTDHGGELGVFLFFAVGEPPPHCF